MKQSNRRRAVDRKIVEFLTAGKSRRWIKERLNVGSGRFEKVREVGNAGKVMRRQGSASG
jgi:hypothetical protein